MSPCIWQTKGKVASAAPGPSGPVGAVGIQVFLPQGVSHAWACWEPRPLVSLLHKAVSPLQPQ